MADLRSLSEAWLEGREARQELNNDSARGERERLGLFVGMFTTPGQLDRQALLDWQAAIGHLRPATRRARVGAVRRFLHWLVAEGYLAEDLTGHLARVRVPRRESRGVSDPEVTAILHACAKRSTHGLTAAWLLPAVALAAGCGLRCVELSRLDLSDYDAHAKTIFVEGKGGHTRMLPLPAAVAEVLDAYIAQRGHQPGPLFQAVVVKGDPAGRLSPKWIGRRIGRAMAAAQVHLEAWDRRAAHSLRHQCAHDAYDTTGDVLVVQALLGHQELSTTRRYLAGADLSQLRAAVEGRSWLRELLNRAA